jgi:hypothetical protein
MGIAMDAFQVTAAGNIPNDHRFLVFGKLEKMGRQMPAVPPITQGVGGFYSAAIEF